VPATLALIVGRKQTINDQFARLQPNITGRNLNFMHDGFIPVQQKDK